MASNCGIIVLALCIAVSGVVAEKEWKNLRVKFGLLNSYFPIALDKKELESKFTLMAHDDELNIDLYSYPNDPRLSVGFDMNGNIAAVRIGLIKEDVGKRAAKKNLSFPYEIYDNPMFGRATYWGTDVYTNTLLFASPETLLAGGRADTHGLLADNVYVKLEGKWTALPRKQSDAESFNFNEQACFPGMGKHYFYKMTKSSECKNVPGVFLLYDHKELVGVGLIPFGSWTKLDREWFEDPPAAIAGIIAPNSPKCMSEWISNYGTTSLHMFFGKSPRTTCCLFNMF